MARTAPLSAAAVRSLIVAAVLAVIGVAMIVIGWPEQHGWQSALLQASWLVFDAAVMVILWHSLRTRRLLPPSTQRFRAVWLLFLGGVGLGLLLYLIALIARAGIIAPLGQLCIAVGLGGLACYLAATSLQPPAVRNLDAPPDLDDLMSEAPEDVDAPVTELVKPRRSVVDLGNRAE